MFSPAAVAGTLDNLFEELHAVAKQAAPASPLLKARLNLAFNGMRDAGTRLRAARTNGDAQAVIEPFLAAANAVLGILAALPLPPQAAIAVRIAGLLLPALSGAAAVLWPAVEGAALAPAA